MGARFAPSVANLFMAHWEEKAVYKNKPPELICYQRYIDDLIMVWEGDRDSLDAFVSRLNDNNKNIVLSWNISTERAVFLDLELSKRGDRINMVTHFKATDRNAFIPVESCHHSKWLCNIPRGQFIRLRRNCTEVGDFLSQSQTLISRFTEKGYDKNKLVQELDNVVTLDRKVLVSNAPRVAQGEPKQIRMILDFNIQHKQFEKIVQKHWPILKLDRTLGPVLPDRPLFIYKRAPSLRDRLAPGVIDPPVYPVNRMLGFLNGFYACGHCPACKQARNNVKKRKEFVAFATGKNYKIKDLITCNTAGVVYMLQCECGYQYVGRTSRPLHVRVGEHVNNIKRGLRTHNVSKHFRLFHNRSPAGLKFWGIEKVTKHWRGGNFIRQLSRRESFWVFETKVGVPLGLNVEFDLNCFISDR